MPKLATPVQYEPALEGLNTIRPLQLADEVKVIIPYPVLCKNPPSENKPAVGMFARCSQQSALLKHRIKEFCGYEYIRTQFFLPAYTYCFVFSQKVSFVLFMVLAYSELDKIYWTDNTYTLYLQEISLVAPTFIKLVGTRLYVRVIDISDGYFLDCRCYGFY